MRQDVQKYIELLKTDEALQSKLKTAAEAFRAEQEKAAFQEIVLPIAEGAGFQFNWEDYQEYLKCSAMEAKDLSLDEMDQVAGGCICMMPGGGETLPNNECIVIGKNPLVSNPDKPDFTFL